MTWTVINNYLQSRWFFASELMFSHGIERYINWTGIGYAKFAGKMDLHTRPKRRKFSTKMLLCRGRGRRVVACRRRTDWRGSADFERLRRYKWAKCGFSYHAKEKLWHAAAGWPGQSRKRREISEILSWKNDVSPSSKKDDGTLQDYATFKMEQALGWKVQRL